MLSTPHARHRVVLRMFLVAMFPEIVYVPDVSLLSCLLGCVAFVVAHAAFLVHVSGGVGSGIG